MFQWTASSAAKLAHLLATEPLISELEDVYPDLDGNTLEERAMAASERAGAEGIVKRIIELATVESKAQEGSPYIRDLDKFEQPAPPKE